ncbi:MAG: hypothetical protein M3R36_18000 [Bacteroidota bacterium]|nr:hypothetical protein [Bacteroidota bacterium]
MKKLILIVTFIFLSVMEALPQWTTNSSVNTPICTANGDQAVSKISNTSDGGCYMAWFDNRNGSYAVYLQRVNKYGVAQLTPNGLLISNSPQSSSLVDWDMITDSNDNAVIVFTDTRNGGAINPFAYKISPNGNFLWGPNGVQLSNDFSIFQSNPKVTETSDNNFVITWPYSSSPRKIALQKLNSAGVPQWGATPIYLSGSATENLDYPGVVTSDNGSVIASWSGYTGSFIVAGNYRIYTQKFSSIGTRVWNATQDTVYSLFRISGFFVPRFLSDGNNGALYAWTDNRNNNNRRSSFVQHYTSAGTILFPLNGAEGSTATDLLKLDPWVSYVPSTDEVYMFWYMTNVNQNSFAIYGQKFNSTGIRQWGDSGIAYRPFGGTQPSFIKCYTMNTSAVVTYMDIISSGSNVALRAFNVNSNSSKGWGGKIVTTSSKVSDKGRMAASPVDMNNMTKLVWSEGPAGTSDIYEQNLNSDGTLGFKALGLNVTIGIEGFWNGTTQVQDTMRFYLRDDVAPYNVVDSSTVYLSSTGNGFAFFLNAPDGNHYIQTRHRNALETWSSNTIALSNGNLVPFDFTTSQNQTFGNNSVLKSGRYCSNSGDVNHDGAIDVTDGSLVDNDVLIFAAGYLDTDVNGDTTVDLSDLSIVDNNIFIIVTLMRP